MHIDSASAYCDGDGDRKLMMMLILVLIVMLGVSNVQLHMYRCTVVPLYRCTELNVNQNIKRSVYTANTDSIV